MTNGEKVQIAKLIGSKSIDALHVLLQLRTDLSIQLKTLQREEQFVAGIGKDISLIVPIGNTASDGRDTGAKIEELGLTLQRIDVLIDQCEALSTMGDIAGLVRQNYGLEKAIEIDSPPTQEEVLHTCVMFWEGRYDFKQAFLRPKRLLDFIFKKKFSFGPNSDRFTLRTLFGQEPRKVELTLRLAFENPIRELNAKRIALNIRLTQGDLKGGSQGREAHKIEQEMRAISIELEQMELLSRTCKEFFCDMAPGGDNERGYLLGSEEGMTQ